MQNKRILLIVILVLVALLVAAGVLYTGLADKVDTNQLAGQDGSPAESAAPDGSAESSPSQLTPAPDFTVYDADGGEHKLSDYFGKPIVLNFWASWCGPCKSEMPEFDAMHAEMGEQVQFLMVNATGGRETFDSAKEFIASSAYTFPVLYDLDMAAANEYGVYSLPTTFFIDTEGYLVAYAQGAIGSDVLQKGIDMISAE